MPRSATEATWRDWTKDEATKQPRRVCSVAGCKESPKRVKETESARGPRKHVYCKQHATD